MREKRAEHSFTAAYKYKKGKEMAFDACMMRAVIKEVNDAFPDAKIEKVLQPQNDEIDMLIHSGKSTKRLVFNVGPNAPRMQLSDIAKENPVKAPMFCMLLRKYFAGARIISVSQRGFDRIAELGVSCYDEMGFQTEKKIICEIMGKYANLIILDSEEKILSALKMIDFSASSVRQVLPGLKYQTPASPERILPYEADKESVKRALEAFPKERTAEKFITSTFSGVATQIARELVYRASGEIDVPVEKIDKNRLLDEIMLWRALLENHNYTPTIVFDKEKPIDYSYMDITYLGESFEKKHYAELSQMLDTYYKEKDRIERIHQRAHDLVTLISNAISRTERKLRLQREALVESERAEEYKKKGDLITANIYKIKKGDASVRCTDYFDSKCPEVEIQLDTRLAPSQNAQKMYKQYSKLKTAKRVLTEQISMWERELLYLDGVQGFLSKAECEDDLAEIRDELYRSGYSSRLKSYSPKKKIVNRPVEMTTSGGMKLLVGKNNIQNELVTFKMAKSEDIWFHTKDIPGSHVVLVTEGKEPTDDDYTEAAAIAAYYSKATADRVAVDYTRVSNIKKVKAGKPGFVIYKTNYTAYVEPMSRSALLEKCKGKDE